MVQKQASRGATSEPAEPPSGEGAIGGFAGGLTGAADSQQFLNRGQGRGRQKRLTGAIGQ